MNRYKDTTPKLTTPQGANKPPIKRVIHGLLDCLLMGMILFVLLLLIANLPTPLITAHWWQAWRAKMTNQLQLFELIERLEQLSDKAIRTIDHPIFIYENQSEFS